MLLFIHIVIALSNVGYATYIAFVPSKLKIRIVYLLTALTLITGTYVAFQQKVNIAHVCVTGLLYTGLIVIILVMAQKRLASVSEKTETKHE